MNRNRCFYCGRFLSGEFIAYPLMFCNSKCEVKATKRSRKAWMEILDEKEN